MISKIRDEILSFFPPVFNEIKFVDSVVWGNVEEIRVRVGQPIRIKGSCTEYCLKNIVSQEDLLKLLENFSNNSIYSVQSDINNGYLTIRGGHRVGISGTSVIEDGRIKNIKYISSINIRIAREVCNCADYVLGKIAYDGIYKNTLIISPPRLWQDDSS